MTEQTNKPFKWFNKQRELQSKKKHAKYQWRYYTKQAIKALNPLNKAKYKEFKEKADRFFKEMQNADKELRSMNKCIEI